MVGHGRLTDLSVLPIPIAATEKREERTGPIGSLRSRRDLPEIRGNFGRNGRTPVETPPADVSEFELTTRVGARLASALEAPIESSPATSDSGTVPAVTTSLDIATEMTRQGDTS